MELKERHGCVTAWLTFMIITNSLTAILYLFLGDLLVDNLPQGYSTEWLIPIGIVGLANLTFAIMLLQWRKWAFWAFAGSSVATLFMNLFAGLGFSSSIFGLSGIIILYGILQIKKNGVAAWDLME